MNELPIITQAGQISLIEARVPEPMGEKYPPEMHQCVLTVLVNILHLSLREVGKSAVCFGGGRTHEWFRLRHRGGERERESERERQKQTVTKKLSSL